MSKKDEALKLALEALEETLRTLDDENAKPGGAISDTIWYSEHETLFDYIAAQITVIREALAEQPAQKIVEEYDPDKRTISVYPSEWKAQQQEPDKDGSPCPEFWDWLPKAYNFVGDGNFTKYNMEVAFLAGKQSVSTQEPVAWRTKNATPPGGYVLFQQYPQAVAEFGGDIQPLYTSPQPAQQEPVATCKQFLQVEELLKDMLDTLPYNSPDYWISRIKEVLPLYTSSQPAQQESTEKELSNGLAMALHDAVLIRIGGNDEATRQAYARIDKLVDKYRAENPDIKPAQQEPVAWRAWFDADLGARWLFTLWPEEERLDVEWQPLYTSPPASKPWVGLTDAERGIAAAETWGSVLIAPQSYQAFAQAIEAKLREKNLYGETPARSPSCCKAQDAIETQPPV